MICDSSLGGEASVLKGDRTVGLGPDSLKSGGDSPISLVVIADGCNAAITEVIDCHRVSALDDLYEVGRCVHT